MSIELRHCSRSFGSFRALDDVSLTVPTGGLVALLGPSGAGKTTLLRIIAGLEHPDDGAPVLFDGEPAPADVARRRVGFVFQHYALFRHMNVRDNVAFGLTVLPRPARPPREAILERVRRLLALVQLDGLEARYPHELSGGQRQRVALARALAIEPRVLLLDEPFGALDAKVRHALRRWLRGLHDELRVTSVFVTHDQEEALEVADRVVVMNRGRIEQEGLTAQVYERPASPFVFDFLGGTNVLPAEVAGVAEQGDVYVRPSDVRVAGDGNAAVRARILSVQRTGPIVRATAVTLAGSVPLTMELPHLHHDVPLVVPGAELGLRLMLFSVYARSTE